MVLDEHGEGIPCVFCYSNRVDETSMTVFLNLCRYAIGSVDGVILMIDDTEVYYNAWRNIMGPLANRLLCAWHVDWAWRKNLSKIKSGTCLKAQAFDVSLYLNGIIISRAPKCRFLGVWLDEHINWSDHINYVLSKIAKKKKKQDLV